MLFTVDSRNNADAGKTSQEPADVLDAVFGAHFHCFVRGPVHGTWVGRPVYRFGAGQ